MVLEFKRGLENEGRGGAVDDEEEPVISVVGEEIDELPKESGCGVPPFGRWSCRRGEIRSAGWSVSYRQEPDFSTCPVTRLRWLGPQTRERTFAPFGSPGVERDWISRMRIPIL